METKKNVVFGSGPLGQSVAAELQRKGQPVVMVNRSSKKPEGLNGLVKMVAGDAYDPEFTRSVVMGAAVVYQCAQPNYWEWPAKFPPLQASILDAAASAGAKLVVGENLYMYGDVDGPIHEDLPYAARTKKGRVRARMAQELLEAHKTGKVRVAIGRGSDFYGPGVLDSALGDRAFLAALQGKAASLGGRLDVPHTFTYIEDFGKALVVLGENDQSLGQVWHVPNPPTLTQRAIMEIFFKEISNPVKLSTVNRLMMAMAGLFIPGARESVEMMYEFEKPFVVDSRKFVQAFGDLATPHEEAMQRTAAWYRKHAGLG